MADKRITDLNLHTSPQLSDVIPIVNSSETKKIAYGSLYNDIRDGLVSGSTQITLESASFTDNGEFSFLQTDGSGNLSFQYVHTMYDVVHNAESFRLDKGTPVYVSGSSGANPNVYLADAADSSKMPVIYVLVDTIDSGQTGRGIILGEIEGVNTVGYPEGETIYVAEGGGWTNNRPSGSTSIVQVLGIVTSETTGGKGQVLNPGPATLPNLESGNLWVGNGTNQPVTYTTSSLIPQGTVSGSDQVTSSLDSRYVQSGSITGSNVVGSNTISTIETMTSASYALITPVSGTLYIITD